MVYLLLRNGISFGLKMAALACSFKEMTNASKHLVTKYFNHEDEVTTTRQWRMSWVLMLISGLYNYKMTGVRSCSYVHVKKLETAHVGTNQMGRAFICIFITSKGCGNKHCITSSVGNQQQHEL